MKKGLLIYYGEWRNFDSIAYQMKSQIEPYDIIISTWETKLDPAMYGIDKEWTAEPITEDTVKEILPNVKKILIHHPLSGMKHLNFANMVFHWKSALPYIDDSYDIVIIHRFDLLSTISNISKEKISDKHIYIDYGFDFKLNEDWSQDWMYVGSPTSIKKWINLFPEMNILKDELTIAKEKLGAQYPHITVSQYCKKFGKEYVLNLSKSFPTLWYILVKCVPDADGTPREDVLKPFNENQIEFFKLEKGTKLFNKFAEAITIEDGSRPYESYMML